MSELKWTKDPPTKEGWYWVRFVESQRWPAMVIHHASEGRTVFPRQDSKSYLKFPDAEWAGPLEPPA